MKFTLSFSSSRFDTWPKSQDKNLNILRTKRAFEVKQKVFFTIVKGTSVAKNCLRSESAPLISCLAVAEGFAVLSLVQHIKVFFIKKAQTFFLISAIFFWICKFFCLCIYNNCVKNIDLLCWGYKKIVSLFTPQFSFKN